MTFEHAFPVITLVLGWALNFFSGTLNNHREYRKGLAKAIADLLEIRHDLKAQKAMNDVLKRLSNFSPSEKHQIKKIVIQQLPQSENLPKRFDETVTFLSAHDPVLGFYLRSKDITGPVLANLRNLELMVEETENSPLDSGIDILCDSVMPHLEETLIVLSRKHGRGTLSRVRKCLEYQELPKELQPLLQTLDTANSQKARSSN